MATSIEIARCLFWELGKDAGIKYATRIAQAAIGTNMSREYQEAVDILLNK